MDLIYYKSDHLSSERPRQKTLLASVGIGLVLVVSIVVSLFFKEKWLWMDEVLSYVLVSDTSLAHMNDAVVSGMDANPPLFANLYWSIGHFISLDTQFLRMVSVVLFASAIAVFFYYTTKLVGTPAQNFLLIATIIALTALNLSLSTQIRAYALFLLISCGYFITLHRLILEPNRLSLLLSHVLIGLGLVFTHNFGLFYLAASGAFFSLLWLWSKQQSYLSVIATHVVILAGWFIVWYPSFAIQAAAGKPHSWIPVPTFLSFFTTVGELAPTISSSLERSRLFSWLPLVRFILITGLFIYIALPKVRAGFNAIQTDKAFLFYLMAGFIYFATISISLVVTLVHTSVFISRYLWPSHLLVIYQLVYAYYYFIGNRLRFPAVLTRLIPVYIAFLAVFIVNQNRKLSSFSDDILTYLPQLDKNYPVFVETADYFLPIWFHKTDPRVRYLLDWQTASTAGNYLNATVEHKILKSLRDKYQVSNVVTKDKFTKANFPHFYAIDEESQYQIEHFIKTGQVKVVKKLPIAIQGHRLLECTF